MFQGYLNQIYPGGFKELMIEEMNEFFKNNSRTIYAAGIVGINRIWVSESNKS